MRTEDIRKTALFAELSDAEAARLLEIARPRECGKAECLFLLGDHADRLYVVLSGAVELNFPVSFGGTVRDVPIEVKRPGSALGWSALVKPYRFTLSAHTTEPTSLLAFLRQDLQRVFDDDPRAGYIVMHHVSEIIGRRLLQVQALWARELQRVVTDSLAVSEDLSR